MDILFKCPNCNKSLCANEAAKGAIFNCPSCGNKVSVPEFIFTFNCPKCSTELGVAKNAIVSICTCPSCEQEIGTPLKDPKTELSYINEQKKREEEEAKKKANEPKLIRREMEADAKIPVAKINDPEWIQRMGERTSQMNRAFFQRQRDKAMAPYIKVAKGLAFIIGTYLSYKGLSILFHPYIAGGLVTIVLMIFVPLTLKAKWLTSED